MPPGAYSPRGETFPVQAQPEHASLAEEGEHDREQQMKPRSGSGPTTPL